MKIESLYATIEFKYGESWRLVSGKNKIETFDSQFVDDFSSF
jgi:hypothetical protein